MKLYIGNKKYSSWSFRPWIAMKYKGIEFEEILLPFEMATGNRHYEEFSPTGKVPCLVDGETTVWESLAILEYLAERFPALGLWPSEISARAAARSVSNEMHGGFMGLRAECPMNMNRPVKALDVSNSVHKDVARIEEIWSHCLQKSGGPFLFGDFSNADAMFAPVVNRIEIYQLSDAESVIEYTRAIKSTAAWKQWEKAGKAEPWIVGEDEA